MDYLNVTFNLNTSINWDNNRIEESSKKCENNNAYEPNVNFLSANPAKRSTSLK